MLRITLYLVVLFSYGVGLFGQDPFSVGFAFGYEMQEMQSDKAVIASSCYEAMQETRQSGLYEILLRSYSNYSFTVACDDDFHYGGWTVIQRRYDGSVTFDRTWAEYKKGFGDLRGEFFIGLDRLYAMTAGASTQELLIVMTNNRGVEKYAHYSSFAIGTEKESYSLNTLGSMIAGNTYNALAYHKSYRFSTKDYDVDKNNCAMTYNGGWWYYKCYQSNLNGKYGQFQGITWMSFDNMEKFTTLSFSQMMIRPQKQFRERL